MYFKKFIIAYDHRVGQKYIETVTKILDEHGIEHVVLNDDKEGNDYPILAAACYERYKKEKADGMILLCGTGIGMNMAANKFKGIRSILATEEYQAYFSRWHENANCIVFGPGYQFGENGVGDRKFEFKLCRRKMGRMLTTFINSGFEGGRHERRVNQLAKIDANEKL